MKKLLELVSKVNIAMLCLLAVTARVVVFGASIGDAIALVGLAVLFGFNAYLNRLNSTWMDTMNDNLKKLRDEISGFKMSQGIRKMNEKPQDTTNKRYF